MDSLEGLGPAGLSALTVPDGASPVTRRVRPGEHDADNLTEDGHGRLLTKTFPTYPTTAKRQGVQGTVILDGLINKEGRISWLRVLTGPQLLQQPSLDAVKQWVYKPYVVDGQPVEVETEINVVFVLGSR